MKQLEKSVIESLDGFDQELFPFIPYIFQDLWEIGSDPKAMLKLIRENIGHGKIAILDLGCGKGAVSITITKALNCTAKGIDAVPEFIQSARIYAEKYNVSHLCEFEVGDIRTEIKGLKGFDIVILGAIGQALGNLQETLKSITASLNTPGYVLLDDAYIEDSSSISYEGCLKKIDFYDQILSSGLQVVDEVIFDKHTIEESDKFIYTSLEKRIGELILQHPDKKELFLRYLSSQEYENQLLENELVTGAWLLKLKAADTGL